MYLLFKKTWWFSTVMLVFGGVSPECQIWGLQWRSLKQERTEKDRMWKRMETVWRCSNLLLGGCFNYFLFSSLLGETIQFDLRICFRWVVQPSRRLPFAAGNLTVNGSRASNLTSIALIFYEKYDDIWSKYSDLERPISPLKGSWGFGKSPLISPEIKLGEMLVKYENPGMGAFELWFVNLPGKPGSETTTGPRWKPGAQWVFFGVFVAQESVYLPDETYGLGVFSVETSRDVLGGGNSNIFYFHPYLYLGKWSNFTDIFQRGWNHQLVWGELPWTLKRRYGNLHNR